MAVLLAGVDALRIDRSWGEVANISKSWTVYFAAIGYVVCLALWLGYYDHFGPGEAIKYAWYYTACRGAVYAPALNLMRGLPFDYHSPSTNSWIDKRVKFWPLVIGSTVAAVITGVWL
jgi:hypothetical protein